MESREGVMPSACNLTTDIPRLTKNVRFNTSEVATSDVPRRSFAGGNTETLWQKYQAG